MTVVDKIEVHVKYDDETLKHVQKIQTNMLKEFIEICDKHDVHYAITYGSAIGAVRHKGFVPWDDEIDVIMFREDYEKFLKIFKKEYKDGKYFLSNWHNQIGVDESYYTDKTFFCLKNTDISHPHLNLGIFIDMNVLDYFPTGKIKSKIFIKKIKLIGYIMLRMTYLESDIYISRNKEILGHFLKFISDLIKFPNIIGRIYTRMLKRYDKKSDCVFDFSIVEYPVPKKYYDEVIPVEFENLTVNLPKGYDQILRGLEDFYGDYMELPPEEDRWNHHFGEIDFGGY